MGKRAYFAKLIQDVRASYWFLPSSLVCMAVLVSELTLYIDQNPDLLPFQLPKGLRDTQVEGARSIMTVISQSVFGVAGVMFSMTVVAVTFASGNYGPRLIGNFMRDRGNQLSLGILVATFVYALLITRAIQSPTSEGSDLSTELFIPHLSIAIALVATFVSLFTVIYFVHHIPETINVSNITAGLGARLVSDLKALIDKKSGDDAPQVSFPTRAPDATITLAHSGYIQTMNIAHLRQQAHDNDLLIDVPCPVGEFVTEGTEVLRVWGADISDEDRTHLKESLALGKSRTENQNLLFIVDQLVEMIARAMSPGVNDPFTAINCLNWLHAGTVIAANFKGGLTDTMGGPVQIKQITFHEFLAAGFGASHHYAKSDPLCSRHLRLLLTQLADQIKPPEHLKTLRAFSNQLED